MSLFLTLFLIGAIGFVAMAFLSAGHAGGHSGSHGAGHLGGHGVSHGVGHGAGHFHVGSGHSAARGPGAQGAKVFKSGFKSSKSGDSNIWSWLSVLSPMELFALALGFGATGILLEEAKARISWSWILTLAFLGALVLNFLVVKPLMGVLIKWQSTPSEGLEGMVATEAEAICAFDKQGKGLVRLTLDGQLVQLLATLEEKEHDRGVQVTKGDKVVILEVDATKNQCRVSRELAA